ncbi:MAG: ABC transporter ATP-binding protein [Pedosphaera sp.]|nr:ABC transporter ATP-binding protein [Pedosphaera sp.]
MNESSRSNLILQASGVCKSYHLGRRTLDVLRNVDLEVLTGEFLVLRGASGAGKSTMLHLMGGLDQPDRGTIVANGLTLGNLDTSRLTRFRNEDVGLIFQAFHLMPELDALENVILPGRMGRRPLKECREAATALLERVGLGNRLDHQPGELSGGEQQRVAIARALINRPSLLLADEPTGNLDTKTSSEIIRLLMEIRHEQGMTLVVATHDSDLAQLADRVVHLTDGCMTAN